MTSYGQIAFRLMKMLPGIDPEVLDGLILDRYTEILDAIKWPRRKVRAAIQTVAPYETGTVTLTEGSTTVTGTGTAWTDAVNGCAFRVAVRSEFYEFAFIGTTAGTLDRPWEGASGSYAYRLYQSVYPLPADCRIVDFITGPVGPLERSKEIAEAGQWRAQYGTPRAWRPFMDDQSEPARMQVEVFPLPDAVVSLLVEYTAEEATFGAGATPSQTTLVPWLRPGALIEGAYARGLAIKATMEPERAMVFARLAQLAEMTAEKYLSAMRRTAASQRGGTPLKENPALNPATYRRR